MSQQHAPETLQAARMPLIQAIGRIIVRYLGSNPYPGHRDWDEIKKMARVARDLERANWDEPGPAGGPDLEWQTLPRAYLDRCSAVDPGPSLPAPGWRTDDLAETVIRETLALRPGF